MRRPMNLAAAALSLSLVFAACSSSTSDADQASADDTDRSASTAVEPAQTDSASTSEPVEAPTAALTQPTAVPAPEVDATVLPFDEVELLALELEKQPGDVDRTTVVDGNVAVVTTVLTTDQGRVTRRTLTFGDGVEETILVETQATAVEGVFATNYVNRRGPFVDDAGFPRDIEGQLTGEPNELPRLTRSVRLIEELGTNDEPLPFPSQPFGGLSPNSFNLYWDPPQWAVSLGGMIEVEPLPSVEAAGTCYLLFGTAEAINRDPQYLLPTTDVPEVSLMVDGQARFAGGRGFLSTELQCDVLDAFSQGYSLVEQGSIAPGTAWGFFASWFVAEGETIGPVVVGDSPNQGNRPVAYFDFDLSSSIVPAEGLDLPGPQFEATEFATTARFDKGDSSWDVTIDDLQQTTLNTSFYGSELAHCFVLTGEATRVEGGDASRDFRDDDIGLVAQGLFRESGNGFARADCDVTAAEAAGYQDHHQADFPPGQPVRFFAEVYLERWLTPEFVALGEDTNRMYIRVPGNTAVPLSTPETEEVLAPGIVRIEPNDEWCVITDKLSQNFSVLGPLPRDDRDLARLSFTQTLASVRAAADRAPDAIANDMELVFSTWEDLVDIHRQADWWINDVDSASITAISERDIDAFAAFYDYNTEACG